MLPESFSLEVQKGVVNIDYSCVLHINIMIMKSVLYLNILQFLYSAKYSL